MQKATEVESTPLADVPKRFSVGSMATVNGFHDVPIDWFAVRSDDELNPDLPWAAMIEGYEPGFGATKYGYGRVKMAVVEMFSEEEAKMLVDYLERTGGPEGAPIMKPVIWPVPAGLTCLEEWIGAGNGGFSFPLSDRDDYDLPFRVDGYCRLIGLLIREEKSGGFVVYKDEVPISTPFADCSAAKAWMSHLSDEPPRRQGDDIDDIPF